jgi:hypothetical protein
LHHSAKQQVVLRTFSVSFFTVFSSDLLDFSDFIQTVSVLIHSAYFHNPCESVDLHPDFRLDYFGEFESKTQRRVLADILLHFAGILCNHSFTHCCTSVFGLQVWDGPG